MGDFGKMVAAVVVALALVGGAKAAYAKWGPK